MSDSPDDVTDEFQQRLESLGLQAHWTDVGEAFAEYNDQGMNSDTALRAAIDDYSREDADIEQIRLEFVREQHSLLEESFEVVAEIPDDIRDSIERRMKLWGESPAENRDTFMDFALEFMEVRFAFELDEEDGFETSEDV
jgi:hypothetical protein